MHDLAQDVAARDGVVGEKPAGLGEWPCVAKGVNHELAVNRAVEVEGLPREIGHTGPVREHMGDRDRTLVVAGVLGDVLADAV